MSNYRGRSRPSPYWLSGGAASQSEWNEWKESRERLKGNSRYLPGPRYKPFSADTMSIFEWWRTLCTFGWSREMGS